jgi:diaminopimelate epimerase
VYKLKVKAIKMHGQGNDYIFCDIEDVDIDLDDNEWANIAKKVSNRHFGIGGDGLVLIQKVSDDGDHYHAKMRMFNADGSEAETCGTALRCTTFYLHEKHRMDSIYLYTMSGKRLCRVTEGGLISVDMGVVRLEKEMCINVDGQNFNGYSVNVGNQHYVIIDNEFLKNNNNVWHQIEKHSAFEHKTNVENIAVVSDNEINMKVWERGSGFTLACGSGACASAFVAHKILNLQPTIRVNMPGGEVAIEILADNRCILKGTVKKVFETEIDIGEIPIY